MSDVNPLSGISGLPSDSPFLLPVLFFCLVLLLFLPCYFSANGPISVQKIVKHFSLGIKAEGTYVNQLWWRARWPISFGVSPTLRINNESMRIALIADAAKGVEEFYSREQIQTVIKPRLYPRPCQFLMKIIPVITCVCACVRTSAEEDNCPREGGGCVYLMIFLFYFYLRVYVLVCQRKQFNPVNFGFARH